MQKVDVILLTKNSLSRNEKGIFDLCLQSLKKNVPISNLIVVDAFSTDGTLKCIRKYFDDVKIIQSFALRGKARQIGITHVQTEFFMFVDDDVVLCENWFEKAIKLFQDPKVGAVWGVDIPRNVHLLNRAKLMAKVRRLTIPQILIRNFKIRGGTHDILIRTNLVKDIAIPVDLHIYEDTYIKEYIESKGYKVLPVENPFCYHYRPTSADYWSIKKGVQISYLELKYGYGHWHTFYYLFRNFLLAIPKSLAIYLLTRDWTAAKQQTQMYFAMFLGCLKVKVKLNPKRIRAFRSNRFK